jgi:hypothetical protein
MQRLFVATVLFVSAGALVQEARLLTLGVSLML